MAASSSSDIPDSKSDYCPCNRCSVARKEGREEIISLVRELHYPFNPGMACDCCEPYEDECATCGMYYPCETIEALEGNKQ